MSKGKVQTRSPFVGINIGTPLPIVCNNTPMHTRFFLNGMVHFSHTQRFVRRTCPRSSGCLAS
ncbi:hypothetical protein RvY_18453 [Ramazzottius varieornatus]|uniref:Uncharacterized protein n=1 Tax=Ramazzottius varieornatus TaxID=947166 RepID=A0A1D1WAG6_RAMVA|nr:hypothetical protein RvY_18453 [Ramazzottius varieornatus]